MQGWCCRCRAARSPSFRRCYLLPLTPERLDDTRYTTHAGWKDHRYRRGPLPSKEGLTKKVARNSAWKLRSESGLGWLVHAILAVGCRAARSLSFRRCYSLHSTPHTPHPTPYTLHPTPCTLHLTPYTLHLTLPKPSSPLLCYSRA